MEKLLRSVPVFISAIFLAGCLGSSAEKTEALLDRLEFDDDETGCVRLSSDLKLGGNPFVGSDSNLIYQKRKGDDAPQC